MLTVHSCHLLFDHFQFALIHGSDIPGSYVILLFTALDLASVTGHIHSWVLFLLWLHPFILSRVISPLISSSMNSMKRQNDRILKEELPRSVAAQYATGDQWRNNFRKNEGMEPKQKQYPDVDVTGDRSKIQCCKEQYCIGTWNVRSMNQGKLEVVKQVMARVNVDILGISELKWTGLGEFNSHDHYIYYCGQESLRRNGLAIMVNKRV